MTQKMRGAGKNSVGWSSRKRQDKVFRQKSKERPSQQKESQQKETK